MNKKTITKVFSLILTIALILSMIGLVPMRAEAADSDISCIMVFDISKIPGEASNYDYIGVPIKYSGGTLYVGDFVVLNYIKDKSELDSHTLISDVLKLSGNVDFNKYYVPNGGNPLTLRMSVYSGFAADGTGNIGNATTSVKFLYPITGSGDAYNSLIAKYGAIYESKAAPTFKATNVVYKGGDTSAVTGVSGAFFGIVNEALYDGANYIKASYPTYQNTLLGLMANTLSSIDLDALYSLNFFYEQSKYRINTSHYKYTYDPVCDKFNPKTTIVNAGDKYINNLSTIGRSAPILLNMKQLNITGTGQVKDLLIAPNPDYHYVNNYVSNNTNMSTGLFISGAQKFINYSVFYTAFEDSIINSKNEDTVAYYNNHSSDFQNIFDAAKYTNNGGYSVKKSNTEYVGRFGDYSTYYLSYSEFISAVNSSSITSKYKTQLTNLINGIEKGSMQNPLGEGVKIVVYGYSNISATRINTMTGNIGTYPRTIKVIAKDSTGIVNNKQIAEYDNASGLNLTTIKPQKDYYTFKGWDKTSLSKYLTFGSVSSETNGVGTVYVNASWQKNSYPITYTVPTLKTAASKPANGSWTVDNNGMKITATSSAKGYTFDGWYKTNAYKTKVNVVTTDDIKPSSTSLNLYGKFVPITYTSSLTPNIAGLDLKTSKVDYTIESKVTLPTPVIARNDYGLSNEVVSSGITFNGYTLNGSPITEVGGNEAAINLGDIKANYTAKSVNITFDAGEGTVETLSLPVTFLSAIPELPTATRKGYDFVKWEAEGKEVKAGNVSKFVEDTTVTAKYTPKKVYLIYDTDGGTVSGKRVAVTFDKEISELSTPAKSGYNFLGWFAGDREVKNGDISDFEEDTTIVAKWEEIVPDPTPTPVPSEEPATEEPTSQPTATPTPEVKGDVTATDLNKYIMADESLTEGQKTTLKEIVKDITKSDGTVSTEEFKEKVKNSDALSNTVKSEIDNVITNTVKQTPLTEKQEEELYKTPEAQKAKALKVTGVKVKAKKKALKVSFKKQDEVTYQIQVSTKKNFKKNKTKTYTSSKNSYTIKKLKKKKTYYVRVRTVKVVDGIEVYGKWSAVKRKKTK
ncbi:MAG: InlB B-repeat-containing protein [Lachnospiraceae bacterium]|nr:InlB B-repeat-containing protein [Lachnospiraceae bacterium]